MQAPWLSPIYESGTQSRAILLISDWMIVETNLLDMYLVGYCSAISKPRVSSQIVNITNRTLKSVSGQEYELVGAPGIQSRPEVLVLWNRWLKTHMIHKYLDISEKFAKKPHQLETMY